MLIKNTATACAMSGTPMSHAACSQAVADRTNCVIACRSVGEYATGLILEGYATKGFHVKSKSCNWGPMAGFVLSDPRFTKTGSDRLSMEGQRTENTKALKGGAAETPVYISDARKSFIEGKGWITRAGGKINEQIYTAASPGGATMKFVLKREMSVKGANGLQMWAVCYGPDETSMPSSPTAPNRGTATALLPVMALVNAGDDPTDCRSALTGDYDLWGIFPPANNSFAPSAAAAMTAKNIPTHGQAHGTKMPGPGGKSMDARMVAGSDRFQQPIKNFIKEEDPHLGNLTGRIAEIRTLLNNAFRAAGYTGGNMIHHSDEVGRPLMKDVELKYIAFVPKQPHAWFVTTMSDMKQFLGEVMLGYHITLNPGWQRQFGFTTTPKGSFEV